MGRDPSVVVGVDEFTNKVEIFLAVEAKDLDGLPFVDGDFIGVDGLEFGEDFYKRSGRDRYGYALRSIRDVEDLLIMGEKSNMLF